MEMVERIKWIMNKAQLTNASFADKIGVQRANISHVLSGRNSASLDLITKIIAHFPDVDVKWLVTGEGNPEMINTSENQKPSSNAQFMGNSAKRTTESVVVLKSDGTFREYNKLPNE